MFPSSGRVAEVAGTAAGTGGLLLVGLVSGADLLTVTVDALSVHLAFFDGTLSVVAFTAFVLATGTYVLWGVWADGGVERATDGPPVCAVVPAYRDADVVDICVESLLDSDYDPVEVAVVVEPDDPRTRRRAAALAADHDAVSCLVNGNPGSKAGAINHAVERSDADFFAVFDADERVAPEFLPAAIGELLDGADVFQGRRVPRPTGVVESLAYCERVVVQAGYAAAEPFGFTHCQSSSTAFTRAAVAAVGGYDDRLTEDIDFSHKCHSAGLTVRRRRDVANTMEAPHSLRDLWGQRKRWRIGHVEVVEARLRETAAAGVDAEDLLSVGRATGAVAAGAFLLVCFAQVLFLLLQGVEWAVALPYASVLGVVGGVWLRDHTRGRVGRPGVGLLLSPLVYLGHGVLTVKALLEYCLTWDGEWYQVTKIGA